MFFSPLMSRSQSPPCLPPLHNKRLPQAPIVCQDRFHSIDIVREHVLQPPHVQLSIPFPPSTIAQQEAPASTNSSPLSHAVPSPPPLLHHMENYPYPHPALEAAHLKRQLAQCRRHEKEHAVQSHHVQLSAHPAPPLEAPISRRQATQRRRCKRQCAHPNLPPPSQSPTIEDMERPHISLPVARQTYLEPINPVSFGHMNIKCELYAAFHWIEECLKDSSTSSPRFSCCCHQGKVHLDRLPHPSEQIKVLFTGDTREAKEFRENIRCVRTSCPRGMRTENFSLITDYLLSNCLTGGCNQLPDMDSIHVSLCLHRFSCFALCTLVYIPTLTASGNVSGSSSYSIRIATHVFKDRSLAR